MPAIKYDPIASDLFVGNRQRFMQQMKPNSIAIFTSNDLMPRSADGFYPFRQNPDIFYLTGIDQEETILVLFPDAPNPKFREVLLIRETNDLIKVWEGHKYTKAEATQTSGIKNVRWNADFEVFISTWIHQAENVYLNLNEHDRFSTPVPYKDIRFTKELQERYPLHNFLRAAPILHALRAIKNQTEIDLMQRAVDITAKAFNRVMRFTKPGVWEYEIEAEILHEYLMNRATGPAYHSIVASGPNACILHYEDNNKQCQDGDVILMDFGAEYANYAADLSRSIPVNGRFTDRQKAVYNATLNVMKGATSMLRPGTILSDYHQEVGKLMESELIGLGLLTQEEVDNQNPDWPAYKKYFMHGTSHFLGVDVHDVGNRYKAIEKGMVFTVEPGIYIPDEGLGIRIENDVVVTDGEPFDLMRNTPREVEEIEDIMNG